MWTQEQPSEKGWTDEPLQPTSILYEFDGPLLFTVRIGLVDLLFYKVDELQSGDLFLVTQTTPNIIDFVKAGKLSVRGALFQQNYWLVETTPSLSVSKYWSLRASEVPEYYFPSES